MSKKLYAAFNKSGHMEYVSVDADSVDAYIRRYENENMTFKSFTSDQSQAEDLKQARKEIKVLKAKLEKAVELATILDNNASHDCWPVKPEGCTCYLGDVRKQLNSITIDSIKRGEK